MQQDIGTSHPPVTPDRLMQLVMHQKEVGLIR